jgi:NADH-quinone oxidoreductase subunit J
MNVFLFYILAAVIVVSTGLAITRRNLAHAVIYLVFSFFGCAMLFYLLGAPMIAALEVIIYAGAIMILFLFIVMMIRIETPKHPLFPFSQLGPAVAIGAIYVATGLLLLSHGAAGSQQAMAPVETAPAVFGHILFAHYGLTIEIASLLLLVVLIGALHIGRHQPGGQR